MRREKQRVLVVDDDPRILSVVGRMLAAGPYEVLTAQDGSVGFEMARTHRPALIILDVAMPKLDGYGVCALLQDDPRTSAIPVLMLTGLAETDEVIRGLDAGADAYVTKPFSVPELLARAGNLIERSRYFACSTRRRVL